MTAKGCIKKSEFSFIYEKWGWGYSAKEGLLFILTLYRGHSTCTNMERGYKVYPGETHLKKDGKSGRENTVDF